MLKKILAILGLAILALVVVVALQPSQFTITRRATIGAPPAAVFARVNDFHQWGEWDPWAKLDPNCKSTFSGPETGAGSTLAWAGNSEVGEGSMKITESKTAEVVRIDLEFLKPMKASNKSEFTFKPDGAGTEVSWTMSGKNNFMGKAFGLVVNCDTMVGGQFEKGLASLKALCEAPAGK